MNNRHYLAAIGGLFLVRRRTPAQFSSAWEK